MVAISVSVGKRRRMAVAMVALISFLAACSPGRATVNPTPSSSAAPATTSTTVDPTRAAILAAYRAHWDDVIAVDTVFPVRPLDPRIGDHVVGKQLTSERAALSHLAGSNHFLKGVTEFSPTITMIAIDNATVTDCLFDHSVEVDFETNMPVESPDIGHTLDVFVMTRVNAAWYVSDSSVLKAGKTGDACTPSTG